jgi:hypothetical protein
LGYEAVGRRWEVVGALAAVVLDLVYQRLGVLYTHPKGKGFGFYQDLLSVEQFKYIAGRVSGGQNHP